MEYSNNLIEIVGVYAVKDNFYLLEFMVQKLAEDIDVSLFTQRIEGESEDNWQVAYEEFYLNLKGDEVIGDCLDVPKNTKPTRLAFYFYYLNIDIPFITPFGELKLPNPMPVPDRLIPMVESFDINDLY